MKRLIMLVASVAIAISAFSQNIIKGEYFIDSDPGFGSATGFEIAVPGSDFTQAIHIPFESFHGAGYHNLFMRTQDSNGNWSQTSRSFVEAEDRLNMPVVIKVEYFFNVDNGFGNNSSVLLDASEDKTWDFNVPFDKLPPEWKADETLFVRVQDDKFNRWSQTTFIDSIDFVMVGIDDFEANTGISIYPNPFTDELNLSLKSDANNLRLVLYSDLGQLVFDKNVEKQESINTKLLAPGIYVLVIYADKKMIYGTKLIKQ